MENEILNLEIYEMARNVPEEAKKPITGGKLSGYTNINPQFRIKRLTEMFGPCGIGWWYEIVDRRLERVNDTPEIVCFVDILLYYTYKGVVSRPIPGTGGNTFVMNTKSGYQASDECFKMALTDAISVASKMIGVAGDVYWVEDRNKYTDIENGPVYFGAPAQVVPPQPAYVPQTPAYPQPGSQYIPAPVPAPAPAPVPQSRPAGDIGAAYATVIDFGKHKGKSISAVIATDREYIEWLAADPDGKFRTTKAALWNACNTVLAHLN